MKNLEKVVLAGAIVILNSAALFAIDEPYLKADHKVLGHQARSSQQHAQDQAHTLYYYSQSQQPIPKPEAKDLVAGIRKDLTAAEKALAALKAEYAKNKDAVNLIESIKKHHAKAHELCGMADEACLKEGGDKVMLGDCCSEMYHELQAAKVETDKLLKSLKIEKLEPPKQTAPKKK